MAFKWREVEAMDDEQLIAAHDKAAEHTVVGTAYYRDELVHRRQSAHRAGSVGTG